jgi:hypothetical protein
MPKQQETHPYVADLKGAMAESGCAVCTLTTRSAMRYVDSLLWQMVNEVDVREELNAARGYCQIHAWMLNRRGGAVGVAILMRDVVKTALRATDEAVGSKPQSAWSSLLRGSNGGDLKETAGMLAPQTRCPICVQVEKLEERLMLTLLDYLAADPDLAAAYRASQGICLPHFRQMLLLAKPRHDTALLLEVQRAVWTRLHGELSEFIRKNDHRFRGEVITPEEADSWRVALAEISGPDPAAGAESRGLTQSLS